MSFFDNFTAYLKPYTRERPENIKNSIGEIIPGTPSMLNFEGIIIKKGANRADITHGDSSIPYWKAGAMLYIKMETDVKKGDTIIDGELRYKAGIMQPQDDFTEKNSHKTIMLELID